MKITRHLSAGVLLLGLTLQATEPSVYTGSYSGSSLARQNKKMILSLRQQVARMQEEIDGLRRVIEGLNQQLQQQRRTSTVKPEVSRTDIEALSRRLAALERKASAAPASSKPRHSPPAPQKTQKPKKPKAAPQAAGAKAPSAAPAADPLQKAASSKLFSRGVRLVSQRRYSDALRRFKILEARGYKPASTQFYLGEIAYRTGRFDDAIRHYQKSAELNENAAYMDRLLLHTAIALEKSGDKEQARSFFQAIVDGYPGTASADVARKHLR